MSPSLFARIRGNSLVELVLIVAVALGLALGIQAFLVKPYRIPSESMVPTLEIGQRVLVNRLSHKLGGDPSVGDVVVFNPPVGASDEPRCGRPIPQERGQPSEVCALPIDDRSDTNFIKRVVAEGGDRIYIDKGYVYRMRKGSTTWERDPFLRDRKREHHVPCGAAASCDLNTREKPATIRDGYFFMMGDNRGASEDSRFWGPVPRKWVIGGAFATYWPPKRVGTIGSAGY